RVTAMGSLPCRPYLLAGIFPGLRARRKFMSKHLAVLDEAWTIRQHVVQSARRRVGFVRVPINTARAGCARLLVHRLDQRAAKATLARARGHEQVLQIA